MKNKYKKLLKNTSIFALGTFGSKLLLFLIVPIYTHILSTSDYGTIDLITSSVSLMIPFTTLLIYEAAIRFLVAKEYNEKEVFNNCIFIFLVGCILTVIFSPCILYFLKLREYYFVFICLIMLSSYTTIFGQFLRATGDNWGFSISGIINTFFIVVLNLFFLLVLKKGINGYFYSLLISYIITSIFIFIKCKTIKMFDYKTINFKYLKYMLLYSLPLVPNNIMWWIMNAGDKYVINYYLGTSANGIFSISYKIPTIITLVFSIFMQAWQISAIEEKESKKDFYKNIFNFIFFTLVICTVFIIILIKPVFDSIIGTEFLDSWKYVPLLCVATVFNCLATFAGVVYIVSKNSKKSFYTTLLGAIVNIAFNFLLIRYIGLFGVAIGTALGYLIVMILRFKDYKKYFDVSLIDFRFIVTFLIIIADCILYIFVNSNLKYGFSLLCILLILWILRKDIRTFLGMIKSKIFFKRKITK